MRYFYKRPFRYRLTRAPRAIRSARLDNIAIVPASMLASDKTLQEKVKTLPRRRVFLYHAKKNHKQKQILERVKEIFQRLGYGVTLLPVDGVA